MNNSSNNGVPYPEASIEQFEIGNDDTSFAPVGLPAPTLSGAMETAPSFQNSTPTQAPNAPTTWYEKLVACFSISSLQQHFDIDTNDVKSRVIGAVVHANKPNYFREQVLTNGENKKADLYGPVWITMTLVFFIAVTGNTSKYLHTDLDDFEYDIGHLSRAFSILMFYTFALPTLLFVMMQCININIDLVEMIAIYGYSLVPYVPTTIFCMVPSVMLEWIFLAIATMMSLSLVMRNIAGPIMANAAQWGGPISMCILGCHFIFFLVLKITFYRHKFHGKNSNGSDDIDEADDGVVAADDVINE